MISELPTPADCHLQRCDRRAALDWRRKTASKGVLFAPEFGSRPRALYGYRDIIALRMFVQLRGDLVQKGRKS